MPKKPNYQHLKKQREAAKKRDQQERLARRHGSKADEVPPKDVP